MGKWNIGAAVLPKILFVINARLKLGKKTALPKYMTVISRYGPMKNWFTFASQWVVIILKKVTLHIYTHYYF